MFHNTTDLMCDCREKLNLNRICISDNIFFYVREKNRDLRSMIKYSSASFLNAKDYTNITYD